MLCSVVRLLESGYSSQEVVRNTRLHLMFPLDFFLALATSCVQALEQNRAQSRLLYLLFIIPLRE